MEGRSAELTWIASAAGGTVGWQFTTNSAVTVRDLGVLDSAQDGLVQAHDVGIFNAAGALLVGATVPVGVGAPLINQFRYAPLRHFYSLQDRRFKSVPSPWSPSRLSTHQRHRICYRTGDHFCPRSSRDRRCFGESDRIFCRQLDPRSQFQLRRGWSAGTRRSLQRYRPGEHLPDVRRPAAATQDVADLLSGPGQNYVARQKLLSCACSCALPRVLTPKPISPPPTRAAAGPRP